MEAVEVDNLFVALSSLPSLNILPSPPPMTLLPSPLIPGNPQCVPLDVPLDHHTKPDYQETSWSLRLLHALLLVLFEGYHTERTVLGQFGLVCLIL